MVLLLVQQLLNYCYNDASINSYKWWLLNVKLPLLCLHQNQLTSCRPMRVPTRPWCSRHCLWSRHGGDPYHQLAASLSRDAEKGNKETSINYVTLRGGLRLGLLYGRPVQPTARVDFLYSNLGLLHTKHFWLSFRVLRSFFMYLSWLQNFFSTKVCNKKMTPKPENPKTHTKKHVLVWNGHKAFFLL